MARDHDRAKAKPFLIAPDPEAAGRYRLILCETRYNSQNYPVVTTTPIEASFATANAARAFAKEEYGAVAGDFTIQKAAPAK